MKLSLAFLLIFQIASTINALAQGVFKDNVIRKKLADYLISAHLAFKFNGIALVARKREILLTKRVWIQGRNYQSFQQT